MPCRRVDVVAGGGWAGPPGGAAAPAPPTGTGGAGPDRGRDRRGAQRGVGTGIRLLRGWGRSGALLAGVAGGARAGGLGRADAEDAGLEVVVLLEDDVDRAGRLVVLAVAVLLGGGDEVHLDVLQVGVRAGRSRSGESSMVKTLGTMARPEPVTARSSMARRMWLAISTGCTAERRCLAKVPWTARSRPASRRSNRPIGAPPPRGSGRRSVSQDYPPGLGDS